MSGQCTDTGQRYWFQNDPTASVSGHSITELEMICRSIDAQHAKDSAIRKDAYRRVLASARTMTREMLIQWLESEVNG